MKQVNAKSIFGITMVAIRNAGLAILLASLPGLLGLHVADAIQPEDGTQPAILDRWTIFSGTRQNEDWNESIAGEACNILYDPLDPERPYKIAIGGYNGPYGFRLKGETRFAYSRDLRDWMFVGGESPSIDSYTEDGSLIRYKGVYYYYCEPMPNRNIYLYTSTDFMKWKNRGIVVGPDIESARSFGGPPSEVMVGSPSAIVRNGRVYLFFESGATANPYHTNKLIVSEDGINFPSLAKTPDLFNRLSAYPILNIQEWIINNLEGLCEHDGKYFGWLSITNKTRKPALYSMWEIVSEDLLDWSFTGVNLMQSLENVAIEGDYISFACLNHTTVVNGKFDLNRGIEILLIDRTKTVHKKLIRVPPVPAAADYLKNISKPPKLKVR